jgi:hypothetical protein
MTDELKELLRNAYDCLHSAIYWADAVHLVHSTEWARRNEFISDCKSVGREIREMLEKELPDE